MKRRLCCAVFFFWGEHREGRGSYFFTCLFVRGSWLIIIIFLAFDSMLLFHFVPFTLYSVGSSLFFGKGISYYLWQGR